MLGALLRRRRHRDARIEPRHASSERPSKHFLQPIASRHVKRADLRTLRCSHGEQRQTRRCRTVRVDQIEGVTPEQRLQLPFQIPADGVVDVRTIVRNQHVATDPLDLQTFVALFLEARSDHSDVVTPSHQFRRSRMDVFGDTAETRVVGLRDDADFHAAISRFVGRGRNRPPRRARPRTSERCTTERCSRGSAAAWLRRSRRSTHPSYRTIPGRASARARRGSVPPARRWQ